jgi:2'-5' RNA ligase
MPNAAMDKMRLFFALMPDETVQQYIVDDTEAIVIEAGGKPVQPRNYHVTLAFLGEVRQSSLDDIVRVARSVRFKGFSLPLDRVGYWSGGGTLWLGPPEASAPLIALVADIWDKLENLGFANEQRLYQPHVTLCRDVGNDLSTRLYEPIEWPVSSFALVHSMAGPNGLSYTSLEQFAAGG